MFSLCVFSLCFLSVCFLSVCFLSVCFLSLCFLSVCFLSVCFLSVFSLCVFLCVFSLCFLSVCFLSVCFLCVFSLCVFCLCVFPLCFLSVCFLSVCFLSVFSLCVFSLYVFCLCFSLSLCFVSVRFLSVCFLSVFSLCFLSVFSVCVFCLCFLSVFSAVFLSLCFLPVFSLCVFCLCFLSVFSPCVFSLCVLSLCVLSVFSPCVFSFCFLSGFAFYRTAKNDTFLSINIDIILLWSGLADELLIGEINAIKGWWSATSQLIWLQFKYQTLTRYFGLSGYPASSFVFIKISWLVGSFNFANMSVIQIVVSVNALECSNAPTIMVHLWNVPCTMRAVLCMECGVAVTWPVFLKYASNLAIRPFCSKILPLIHFTVYAYVHTGIQSVDRVWSGWSPFWIVPHTASNCKKRRMRQQRWPMQRWPPSRPPLSAKPHQFFYNVKANHLNWSQILAETPPNFPSSSRLPPTFLSSIPAPWTFALRVPYVPGDWPV